MKKAYMPPLTTVEELTIESMIATSITAVGGDTGIEQGEGEAPATADGKDRFGNEMEMAVDAEPQYGDLWQ